MFGLDTSHCEAFVTLINDAKNVHHVPGGRVAAAYPGGSQLCAVSRDRVAGFTRKFKDEHGIRIVDDIKALRGMDAFLLESVDGRQHLEQFKVLAEFGKPVFIDKPLACSSQDARGIAELSERKGVPVVSASSIRFGTGIAGLTPAGARVQACEAFGSMGILDDYPGYFWYGVHSADVLYSYMGMGCARVQAFCEKETDLLVGRWKDGRIGTVRGTRFEGGAFGCTVYTSVGVRHGLLADSPPPYARLLQEVMAFFQGGKPPIAPAETVEVMAFLEAAGRSRENGGQPVELAG
jgi:predicted dehydrogenase